MFETILEWALFPFCFAWGFWAMWRVLSHTFKGVVETHEKIAHEQATDLRRWREQIERAAVQNALGLPSMGYGPCQHEYTDDVTRNCGFCGRGGLVRGQSCPGCGAAD